MIETSVTSGMNMEPRYSKNAVPGHSTMMVVNIINKYFKKIMILFDYKIKLEYNRDNFIKIKIKKKFENQLLAN